MESVVCFKNVVGGDAEVVSGPRYQVFQCEGVCAVGDVDTRLNETASVPTVVLEMVPKDGQSSVEVIVGPCHLDRARVVSWDDSTTDKGVHLEGICGCINFQNLGRAQRVTDGVP